METKMQTSFIPKKPIVESRMEGSGVSLFLLLAIIIFIVSLAMAGGVFLWQKKLQVNITNDITELAKARDSYEQNTIEPIIRLDDRIASSQRLLSGHVAVTPLFKKLQDHTIRNVQLKSLKFTYGQGDKIQLDLSGIAKNYDALSGQSDVFGSSILRDFISQPVISDFNLNPDGTVAFNFTAMVAPALISYANTLATTTPATIEAPLNSLE